MLVAALVLAGLAAVLHVLIFWLESIAWMRPRTREIFGRLSEDDARTTRALAFNQGFYNLFLAITVAAGIVLIAAGETAVGAALIYAGAGSMVAAAGVLVAGSRAYARAAVMQGTLPALALVVLTVAVV